MRAWSIASVILLVLAAGTSSAIGQTEMDVPPPQGFPQFEFKGFDQESQVLTAYLWYHFHNRPGNSPCLFNKEWLMLADLWLGGTSERSQNVPIQEIHRAHLLELSMDRDGYVGTHQHYSHAHDLGWPFPLWTQADVGPDKVAGKAVGWHFKPLDQIPIWVDDYLRAWKRTEYYGQGAIEGWELGNLESEGIVDNAWRLKAVGESPTLTTPAGMTLLAESAPFMQLRWKRTGQPIAHNVPYLEWQREEDEIFSPERRMYFYLEQTPLSEKGLYHSHLAMYEHPLWDGKIKRMRLSLAPGESDVSFDIDSFFTVFDTRHSINNPVYIMAHWYYFAWTGDLDFLRERINSMRTALRYQQKVMGGLEFKRSRNPWPGHDGLAGWTKDAEGNITVHSGHGIGNNYWDLVPFGWDDFYATYMYYRSTLMMASLEEAIAAHPGWGIPAGVYALDPEALRRHASEVKNTANKLFWNPQNQRFYASIDKNGTPHDYGFTFVNLEAIWYGIASEKHAALIMDWITGQRIVEGDTSTGADIYHWRFGPRSTTLRNTEWYGQGWIEPEQIPWGGQVQDGGAVLGFSFFDLWAQLKVLGPDNAWERLREIAAWEKEVKAEGGYRAYYADGKQGTTLQGGGTAGGLGIDHEFFESSLLPAIIPYGFLGLDPQPAYLTIDPALPSACPELTLRNVLYRNCVLDIAATKESFAVIVKDDPVYPLSIHAGPGWKSEESGGSVLGVTIAGTYRFVR